jgi:hypothetical protein
VQFLEVQREWTDSPDAGGRKWMIVLRRKDVDGTTCAACIVEREITMLTAEGAKQAVHQAVPTPLRRDVPGERYVDTKTFFEEIVGKQPATDGPPLAEFPAFDASWAEQGSRAIN